MKPLHKGLVLGLVQFLLVSSLGAKLLYDRATRPRVWVRTAPYDPALPIRGRYLSLQLEVSAPDIPLPADRFDFAKGRVSPDWWRRTPVVLSAEDGQLVGRRYRGRSEWAYREDFVAFRPRRDGTPLTVLDRPVLYFIPEDSLFPWRSPPNEELWVEVTLPRKGPPRPIRLGIKKDGQLTPLDID